MIVKMIAATYFGGKRLKPGDTVNVDGKTGARWEKNVIAKTVENKTPGNKPLERMNTEELIQTAAALGVDLTGMTTNKQRVETIKAFTALDPSDATPEDEEQEE